MSSPIAKVNKNIFEKTLINFHQKASHSTRISKLAALLSEKIKSQFPANSNIKCLDVGCGDMTIAETIEKNNPNTSWKCIDIHPLPEDFKESEKWKKYKSFDGQNIPFPDYSFDVVIFCDVLHHTPDKTEALLKEAARVGRIIIIKDHFEYGWYSRNMLRLMDWVGNWSYGIDIPEHYFSQQSFKSNADKSNLSPIEIHKGIKLYEHNPILNFILSAQWQFIATLKSSYNK